MLDQLFTAENFRRIFDQENRKGNDLASRFFPTLRSLTDAVREQVQLIRDLRTKQNTLKAEEFSTELIKLQDALKACKAAKSAGVDAEMEKISQQVANASFRLDLRQKMGPHGKEVFCIDHAAETFFVVKQMQININRIYKVKQANRHDLVSQVRDILRSRFPFEIVRTDISSFYESIDRKRLLRKLDDDQLLSSSTKKFVRQALASYGALTGSSLGIPRGLGVSAYLAELYLRPFDQVIHNIPGNVLYCRYVDDIVAVFARPPTGTALGEYKLLVCDALAPFGLTANAKKTHAFTLSDSKQQKFEYLGYRFVTESGTCKIWPSSRKIRKYYSRLKTTFSAYDKLSHVDGREAFRNLVARIKFLTGNTHLTNSKSRAAVGVFYSNSLADQMSSFRLLDKFLRKQIKSVRRSSLRNRLKPFTFESGFCEKRYHRFSSKELRNIVQAWKNG